MPTSVPQIWEEWKRLTRFLECSKIAFARELDIWSGLQIPDLDAVSIATTEGRSTFKLSARDHLDTLRDEGLLFTIVLTYSYSLAESFTRLRLGLAETDQLQGGIEQWGTRLLQNAGNAWGGVLSGRAGLIEVAVVRNFLAHGSRTVTQKTVDRFSIAGEACPWSLGDSVSLTYALVEEYRSRLKSLMRMGNT